MPGPAVGLLGGAAGLALITFAAVVGNVEQQMRTQCGIAESGAATNTLDAHVGAPLDLQYGQVVSVAATTYGGSTGSIVGFPGQQNLADHPDTYAELSTLAVNPYPDFHFSDADALGNLRYMTPLRVTHDGKSMILYKRDIGFGQGRNVLNKTHPARIDIYAPAAQRLGVSYDMVDISLAPRTGAGNTLGSTRAIQEDDRLSAQQQYPNQAIGSEEMVNTYLDQRRGRVAFAIAEPDGTIAASYKPNLKFRNASMARAMVLVALLRKRGSQEIDDIEQDKVGQMIINTDDDAAGSVIDDIGLGALAEVAHAAGMTSFDPPTGHGAQLLSSSLVTAADQARFFAQIDKLLPAKHRGWALDLLADQPTGQWGIVTASLPGKLYATSGQEAEATGTWTVTQGGQISTVSEPIGIAFLTDGNPDQGYAHETIHDAANALFSSYSTSGVIACDNTARPGNGPLPLAPGSRAKILPSGVAAAPRDAPLAVKQIIAAGNQIIDKPYDYGGGHNVPLSTLAKSYDCSSSVSHALWGAGLLSTPVTSGVLTDFGQAGPGQWVTIEANAGHVYMYVAGLRFDTSDITGTGSVPAGSGPRWRAGVRSNDGFVSRHPPGL